MTRLISSAAGFVFAVVAIVLLPSLGHAGGMNHKVTFEVINTPMSVEPNAATLDCSTETDCTWISSIPEQGMHNPAIKFTLGADQLVDITAGIWGTLDCPGDPDAVASGTLSLMAGENTIRIVFTPPLDDGTSLALEWLLGPCPITACGNYASLGSEPPPFCNPPM